VGIDFDQKTGKMSLAWSVNESTLSLMDLIGPANHRVLVATNYSPINTNPMGYNQGPKGANYVEQVQWRDTETGKLLAASDFFAPMPQGMQVWPGYGGLIYFAQLDGHIVALQVLPTSPKE